MFCIILSIHLLLCMILLCIILDKWHVLLLSWCGNLWNKILICLLYVMNLVKLQKQLKQRVREIQTRDQSRRSVEKQELHAAFLLGASLYKTLELSSLRSLWHTPVLWHHSSSRHAPHIHTWRYLLKHLRRRKHL